MVCPYCGSESEVFNSRPRMAGLAVWRRRLCPSCGNKWTTHEEITTDSYRLRKNGRLEAFKQPNLIISLYECLKHRKNAAEEANALAETVLAKLRQQKSPVFEIETVKNVAYGCLMSFDQVAGQLYAALHPFTSSKK